MLGAIIDPSAAELALRTTTAGGRGVWSRTGFALLGGVTAFALSRTIEPVAWLALVLAWEWLVTPYLLAVLHESRASQDRYLRWQAIMTVVGASLFALYPFLLFPLHGVLGGMIAVAWIAGAAMHAAVFLSASPRLLAAGLAPVGVAAVCLPLTFWAASWQSALVAFAMICVLGVAIGYTVQGNQFLAHINRRLVSRAAAARTARAREQIVAILAHELRTPVHAIDGYSGLMIDDLVRGSIEPADLQKLKAASARLVRLVDRASELMRLESGVAALEVSTVALAEVLEDVLRRWSPAASERSVMLSVDAGPRASVSVDARKLSTALDCLVENAITFSRHGAVTLTARLRDDTLTVVVSDTGAGFDAETGDRIFDVFEQGDMSSTRTHDGAGLGLALAQKLARAMGGDLDAVSLPGAGSTFRLSVLAAPTRTPGETAEAHRVAEWEAAQCRQALEAALDAAREGAPAEALDWLEEATHYLRRSASRPGG